MQPQTSFDLSSGLNALLQNKVERPAKKANIPAGMQALIQAQQILRQQAKPTTPEGQPTVASQVELQASSPIYRSEVQQLRSSPMQQGIIEKFITDSRRYFNQ